MHPMRLRGVSAMRLLRVNAMCLLRTSAAMYLLRLNERNALAQSRFNAVSTVPVRTIFLRRTGLARFAPNRSMYNRQA